MKTIELVLTQVVGCEDKSNSKLYSDLNLWSKCKIKSQWVSNQNSTLLLKWKSVQEVVNDVVIKIVEIVIFELKPKLSHSYIQAQFKVSICVAEVKARVKIETSVCIIVDFET